MIKRKLIFLHQYVNVIQERLGSKQNLLINIPFYICMCGCAGVFRYRVRAKRLKGKLQKIPVFSFLIK